MKKFVINVDDVADDAKPDMLKDLEKKIEAAVGKVVTDVLAQWAQKEKDEAVRDGVIVNIGRKPLDHGFKLPKADDDRFPSSSSGGFKLPAA